MNRETDCILAVPECKHAPVWMRPVTMDDGHTVSFHGRITIDGIPGAMLRATGAVGMCMCGGWGFDLLRIPSSPPFIMAWGAVTRTTSGGGCRRETRSKLP